MLCECLALFALRPPPLASLGDVLLTLFLLTPRVVLASRKRCMSIRLSLPVFLLDGDRVDNALLDVRLVFPLPEDLVETAAFLALSFHPTPLADGLSFFVPRLLALLARLPRLANLSQEASITLVLRVLPLSLPPDDPLRPRCALLTTRLPFLALVEVGLPRRLLSELCLPRLPIVDDQVGDVSRPLSRLLRASPDLTKYSSLCSSRLDDDLEPDFSRLALVLLGFPCFDGSLAKPTPAMFADVRDTKYSRIGRCFCETLTCL